MGGFGSRGGIFLMAPKKDPNRLKELAGSKLSDKTPVAKNPKMK